MRFRQPFIVIAIAVLVLAQSALAAGDIEFGRYHALVIGNNDYQNLPKLETAVGDAEAVAQVLKQNYGFEVRLMRNATRADILRALNKYRADLTDDDNLLVYYAGHGWLDRQTGTGFWQPVDADADDDLNWIANDDLTRRLNAMTARHVMIIADSCYSGTLVRAANTELPTGQARDTWLKRMAEKRSRTAIVSGGLEPVADAGRGGHSVFASALLTALRENRSVLEGTALFKKISRPVVVNADQTPQYADIRKAGHEGGEFLFVPVVLAPRPAAPSAAPAPTPRAPSNTAELAFWQSVQNSKRISDFEAYLTQFPKGVFAPLAQSRIAALRDAGPQPGDSKRFAGAWNSEIITVRRFKTDVGYRTYFDLKVTGNRVLGLVREKTEPGTPNNAAFESKRSVMDGKIEGDLVTFRTPYRLEWWDSQKRDWVGKDYDIHYSGIMKDGLLELDRLDTYDHGTRSFTARKQATNE